MSLEKKGFFTKLTQIEPEEIKGAVLAFIFIFILMASAMILRPVRDALPSDWGDVTLAQQWTITFVCSIIAVALYNFCASKITLKRLVPGVFIFFALSFIAIYGAYQAKLVEVAVLGKVFYVWSSVFSLFHISVFWSFISQYYNKAESKRIFGFINTGASAGAIIGPLVILKYSKYINSENILLIIASGLFISLPLIVMLNRYFESQGKAELKTLSLSSNPLSGLQEFLTHRRLLGIAAFIFFYTSISSFLYSTQKNILADYSDDVRESWLAGTDLVTHILTIVIGLFATNRISKKFGMPITLSMVPFMVSGLILLLSLNPIILLVMALQVVRKAGNYAITRPAREILYTAVDREARFKTKPIIDVAVYRGGDVFWIWIIAMLGDGWLHLGVAPILCVGALVAAFWGVIGIYLGRKHDHGELDEE